MKTHFRWVLTLGALLLAGSAVAGEEGRPVNERRPLKADARVSVENTAGHIEVEAWDKNELLLTGDLSEEVEKLEITGNESSLKIEVKLPKKVNNVGDTTLHLRVPAGVSLNADAVSADIHVRGLRGRVSAETVSGDVQVDVQSKRVEAASVSGDVSVNGASEEARVQSVSGDVSVRGTGGEIDGESVSGDVHVTARAVRRLELETVSGDMFVDADLARDAEVKIETLSGELRVTLPQLPRGRIELETFSGSLESDLVKVPGNGKEYSSDDEGKGRLRLHSFSGDIHLKKK